jgi:hypothetical protein
MQAFCEADAGTRTPDPFITSEERRFRMFAAGLLFACSRPDLASLFRTAFAAVSGCSIAHSLPTSTSTGKLGFAPAGGSSWLQVLAPARHRPRGCATRVRAHPASSRTLPCVWRRCAAGPRRASRSSRPLAAPGARSGRLSWPRARAPKPGQRPGRPAAAWIGRPALVAPHYLRPIALLDCLGDGPGTRRRRRTRAGLV